MKKLVQFPWLLLLPAIVVAQNQVPQISPADDDHAMEYYIRGVSAFENGEYQQAIDLLNIAYLQIPEFAGVNYAMADAYLALDDFSNAGYYASIAADREPENRWYHLKLVEVFVRSGQSEMAIEALIRALDDHSEDLDLHYHLASLYSEYREFEKSNEIYDRALAIHGSVGDLHLGKYRNYMHLNQPESALVELQKIRSLDPENLDAIHALSQLHLELDDVEAAIGVLQEAKRLNSRKPETLILLADIYIQEAKWDSLGNTFVSMIEDPLLSGSQKMELARFLYLRQQSSPDNHVLTKQTRRVLESFSRNEPDFGESHLLAAEFHLGMNEIAAAVEKLELANRVMPSEVEPWRQRMQLMFMEGRYEEVIETGLEAMEHLLDDAFIYYFTGSSYMIAGEHEPAAEWLGQAALLPARSNFRSIIHGSLGDVLTELDRWEEARESYESAIRLDRANHVAMNNYAYYLAIRHEQLDYAEELALQATAMEPQNAAYLDTIGWIYYQMGFYEKAREYIRSSIDTGQASAEVFEHMGDVYEKLEQSPEAKNWWERALEADPDRIHLKNKINSP